MSVKKDNSGRRSVQVEVEVLGTVEEVWQAIATGPGVSSWFVPCEIDAAGRTVKMSFGPGMDSVAKITEWDPPRRFAAEGSDWGPGSPPVATEWIVEARGGNACVVRVVHSLFASTDDWDNQLESTESGWPVFFQILRRYLERYRGQPCSIVQSMAMTSGAVSDAWARLTAALGLTGVTPGQRWAAPAGVPPLAGVIEEVGSGRHPMVLLRLDEPAPGTGFIGAADCGGVMGSMSLYLYGGRAGEAAKRDGPRWQEWLAGQFPAPASS